MTALEGVQLVKGLQERVFEFLCCETVTEAASGGFSTQMKRPRDLFCLP